MASKARTRSRSFGNDLDSNERIADAIVDVMAKVDGIKDLGHFKSMGQPNIKITPNRELCARYGLNTGDIDSVVQAAIGGQAVVQVYEGEKHFDLTVRWKSQYRMSLEAIREITVATPDGSQLPLGELADTQIVDGPAIIYREDARRFPRSSSASAAETSPARSAAAQTAIEQEIPRCDKAGGAKICRPYDTRLGWAGEINELHEAEDRLTIIIPMTILLITFLTYSAVKTWVDTILVLTNIPVACTGGVFALLFTGTNFSVSAAMGFISIFGIAIQDSILVVTYFQRLRGTEGHRYRAGGSRGRREATATLLDDHAGRYDRSFSRRDFERHRLSDPKAVGHRRHRGLDDVGSRRAHGAAPAARRGAHMAQAVPAWPRAGRSLNRPRWIGRRTVGVDGRAHSRARSERSTILRKQRGGSPERAPQCRRFRARFAPCDHRRGNHSVLAALASKRQKKRIAGVSAAAGRQAT